MANIEVTIDNAVAVVRLNRPAERNAMTLAMWRDVARIFSELGRAPTVRAIVLTGAGGNFSVGADVSEFAAVRSNAESSAAYEVAVDASSDAIAGVPKPVIAVIEGYCLGGGCHLSMACDFRFTHSDASIGIPAAKLSIVYGIRSTQRLLSLVGLTNAKRILYSAERFGAAEAEKMGFSDRVSDNPMRDAKVFAASIAMLAPLSVAGAKLILTDLTMGQGALETKAAQSFIDQVSASEDYEEGRRAFAEKRPAIFKGR
ncbi:MAG: enoyl-CoA hydratase/isomerase family protein [Afipia sp.]|nr:enoyl-CoA hydratase/isomerase family protein [Afipia sp.]MBS4004819.1 enoyl-CoA hydratase/isomerase family protein [Afipia sp.]WIG51931.1 MAG: Enoyl-CoA hydratase [Afipia sp.]